MDPEPLCCWQQLIAPQHRARCPEPCWSGHRHVRRRRDVDVDRLGLRDGERFTAVDPKTGGAVEPSPRDLTSMTRSEPGGSSPFGTNAPIQPCGTRDLPLTSTDAARADDSRSAPGHRSAQDRCATAGLADRRPRPARTAQPARHWPARQVDGSGHAVADDQSSCCSALARSCRDSMKKAPTVAARDANTTME